MRKTGKMQFLDNERLLIVKNHYEESLEFKWLEAAQSRDTENRLVRWDAAR